MSTFGYLSQASADTFSYPAPTVAANSLRLATQATGGVNSFSSTTTQGELLQFNGANFGKRFGCPF